MRCFFNLKPPVRRVKNWSKSAAYKSNAKLSFTFKSATAVYKVLLFPFENTITNANLQALASILGTQFCDLLIKWSAP